MHGTNDVPVLLQLLCYGYNTFIIIFYGSHYSKIECFRENTLELYYIALLYNIIKYFYVDPSVQGTMTVLINELIFPVNQLQYFETSVFKLFECFII